MPLISTFGSSGSQSFGNRGIITGGSGFFNGNGDSLTTAPNNAFVYGTGNFTIEMWVYPTSFADYRFLWQQTSGARDTRFWIYTQINTGQLVYVNGINVAAITTNGLNLNEWNHIALVRNSLFSRFFLNGVGYSAGSDNRDYNTDSTGMCIGKQSAVSNLYPWAGWITNVRVAKQALYTSNFTPSRVPFTRTSQNSNSTQLLLNMNSTFTLSTDSSSNAIPVTNTGLVTYSVLTPFNRPYVTPPTVIVSSAVVTLSTTTPNEGDTITVNVVGTNTPNGTYYYTLQEELGTGALTGADFTSGSLSGSFNINGNSGSFPITVTRDLLTEGNEVFTIYVRQTSTSGPIIGTSAEITIVDTSITPTVSPSAGSVNEGDSLLFTATNLGPDGTYFWTILNGTTANADFGAVSGSFLVSGSSGGIDNGSGSFNIDTVLDRTTEGSQTFQVQVRSGSTSGTVLATSSSVTINDTSLTPSFVSAPTSINEGSSGNFQVNNLGPAGTYYWVIQGGTAGFDDFVSTTGQFNTTTLNGTGSFTIDTIRDYLTEGPETFSVLIRSGSLSGPTILTSPTITINDTSQNISVTVVNPTVTEGQNLQINVGTSESTLQTLYWNIIHGTTTSADFAVSSASFNLTNSGTIFIQTTANDGAEPAQTFQVEIRRDSNAGPILWTSGTLTIAASLT